MAIQYQAVSHHVFRIPADKARDVFEKVFIENKLPVCMRYCAENNVEITSDDEHCGKIRDVLDS